MTINQFQEGKAFAAHLDENDQIADYRTQFYIPDSNTIYLDGNSLGRLPQKTRETIQHQVDHQWGTRLIRSWNEGWYERSEVVSKKIARIIGAGEDEVMTGDSTSLNLYKLVHSALGIQKGRTKIISDELNFPTDLYIIQGIINQLGSDYELLIAPSSNSQSVDLQTLNELIDQDTALVILSHIAFKSAFMYDLEKVTDMAHQKGALMLWDLSHSAGVVPLDLSICNADFAVGCTYKYLNGGPGSPAYLYIRKGLQDRLTPPVWGWFGDRAPFSFDLQYKPATGIRKFMVGTPPILSLEAISPGLDVILDAGIDQIRQKSILQTEYLIFLFGRQLKPLGFSLGSPDEAGMRGSHVSLQHPEAYKICKALINPKHGEKVVIPDFRKPDNIRLGISPLYTSFNDIYLAVERLRQILKTREHRLFTDDLDTVT